MACLHLEKLYSFILFLYLYLGLSFKIGNRSNDDLKNVFDNSFNDVAHSNRFTPSVLTKGPNRPNKKQFVLLKDTKKTLGTERVKSEHIVGSLHHIS